MLDGLYDYCMPSRARVFASSLAVLLAVGIAASLAPISQAAGATARCTTSQVAVTIDGKRTCTGRAAVKQIVPTTSNATWFATRLYGLAGVRPAQLKLTGGAQLFSTLTTAEAQHVVAAAAQAESILKAAALTALETRKSRRGRSGRSVGRAIGDVTYSEPTVNVTETATSMQASAELSATVDLGAGKSTKLTVDIDARKTGDAEAVFKVGIDFENNDGAGVTSGYGAKMQLLGGKYDVCPSIKGEVRYTMPASLTSSDRLSEKLGPIDLGFVNSARSTKSMSKATVVMNADATLPAIPFSITVTSRQSFVGQILAVFGAKHSYTAVATARGSIDPKSGMPSASTVFDVRTVGGGLKEDAGIRSKLARESLAETRELMGKMVKHFRDVEKRARGGECTKLQFDPASGATLARNAKRRVEASLRSKVEGNASVPTPVRWTVTSSLGTVTPASGTTNGLPTTVTGAKVATGGVTARVTYRAVSRAGISTGQWVGTETAYPKIYAGTYSDDQSLNGITTEHRAANLAYALQTVTNNPDGSTQLWYHATTATVTAATYSDTFGCSSAIVLGTNRIVAGDVEIIISKAGTWTGAMQIDIDMGTQTITCPSPIPPSQGIMKALFNSRTSDAVPALRPMDPRGPITGSLTYDTYGRTGSGTWRLDPRD